MFTRLFKKPNKNMSSYMFLIKGQDTVVIYVAPPKCHQEILLFALLDLTH